MKADTDNPSKIVARTLDAVASRKFRALFHRSILAVTLAAITGLLISVVVDWFAVWQNLPGRWAGPLLTGIVIAFFALRSYRIHRTGPDKAEAAATLDRTQKNSQDRWTTFAALQDDGVGATGSNSMMEAMIRDMAPKCRFFDPASVEPLPIPKRTIGNLIAVTLVLLIFLGIFFPQGSPRLIARFLAPWAQLPLTRLSESSPPPPVLLKGSDLDLAAAVSGKRTASVRLEIAGENTASAEAEQIYTAKNGGPVSQFNLDNLREPFQYRFVAGDASTPWQPVNVVAPPRLSVVNITVSDPAYSTRPPRKWSRWPSNIEAIKGSRITLLLEADQPLSSAKVTLTTQFSRPLPIKVENNTMRWDHDHISSFTLLPEFKSIHGFANQPLAPCRITTVEDQAPTVELTGEGDVEILSTRDNFEISFIARDDIGVATAEAVFGITDQEGNRREVSIPLDLGEAKNRESLEHRQKINLAELGLGEDEQLDYSVKVADSSNQKSSSNQPTAEDAPAGNMTKRSLKIGGGSVAQTEPRPINFSSKEIINEVEPKQKKTLAIESAFETLKRYTAEALSHTGAARKPPIIPGQTLDLKPLFSNIGAARQAIETAGRAVNQIAEQAPGTPYAFLSLQLQTITTNYLEPADKKLNDAVRNCPEGLPPREIHRMNAETYLNRAMAQINTLEGEMTQIRSKVETEVTMTKMMTMYLAQVEDIPALLQSGNGTPYQRSPGEVDRAQAEAALAKLEALKEVYQKTAELLQQNPELWQRYMDKSKDETTIFRDELEGLAHRHKGIRNLSRLIENDDMASPEVDRLIETHQTVIRANLLRSLDKAQIWLDADPNEKPAWLKSLEDAIYGDMKSTPTPEAVAEFNTRLDHAIKDMVRGSKTYDNETSFALRLGELEQARSESRLVAELISARDEGNWQHIALLEQANIAHLTQKLAGKIELEGARLDNLSPEVAAIGKTLHENFQQQLLPSLSRSVFHLQQPGESNLASARSAQSDSVEHFALAVKLLDSYVNAAIKEMDKAPAKASAGGGPKITANTLEELERKLQEEKAKNDSFGIPCCRPTNFQVMSDWERVSQCNNPSESPSSKPSQSKPSKPKPAPSDSPESKPSQSQPKPGQMAEAPKPSDSPSEGKDESPGTSGDKRSELDLAELAGKSQSAGDRLSEIARANALKQAKEMAEILANGGNVPSPEKRSSKTHGDTPAEGLFSEGPLDNRKSPREGSDWNRLNSTLTREILQEKSNSMPAEYRDAIEAYFRNLARWETKSE